MSRDPELPLRLLAATGITSLVGGLGTCSGACVALVLLLFPPGLAEADESLAFIEVEPILEIPLDPVEEVLEAPPPVPVADPPSDPRDVLVEVPVATKAEAVRDSSVLALLSTRGESGSFSALLSAGDDDWSVGGGLSGDTIGLGGLGLRGAGVGGGGVSSVTAGSETGLGSIHHGGPSAHLVGIDRVDDLATEAGARRVRARLPSSALRRCAEASDADGEVGVLLGSGDGLATCLAEAARWKPEDGAYRLHLIVTR